MRLLILVACCLMLARGEGSTPITDAQRIEYRTLERDYYRIQLQIAALDAKGNDVKAHLTSLHGEMAQACGGQLDETTLTCANPGSK